MAPGTRIETAPTWGRFVSISEAPERIAPFEHGATNRTSLAVLAHLPPLFWPFGSVPVGLVYELFAFTSPGLGAPYIESI